MKATQHVPPSAVSQSGDVSGQLASERQRHATGTAVLRHAFVPHSPIHYLLSTHSTALTKVAGPRNETRLAPLSKTPPLHRIPAQQEAAPPHNGP
jgi:hypothetical protein